MSHKNINNISEEENQQEVIPEEPDGGSQADATPPKGKNGVAEDISESDVHPRCPTFDAPLDRTVLHKQLQAVSVMLRYNSRAHKREWSVIPDEGESPYWKILTIDLEDSIFCAIQEKTRLRIKDKRSTDKFRIVRPDWGGATRHGRREMNVRAYLTTRQADPFVDWLKQLPDWDGIERLDDVFRFVGFNIPDNVPDLYLRWASKMTLLAAVRRARQPGAKYDTVVILAGDPGAGKSEFWRNMLTEPSWFGDTLHLTGDEKQMLEACLGKVIVESSELNINYRYIEKVKAYISRSNDNGIRLAYDAGTTDRPRQFVIVGTTNEAEALPPDRTGLRRFWPVPVYGETGERVIRRTKKHRDQIWAEAVWREASGEKIYPPQNVRALHAEMAEEHRIKRSTEEQFVEEWISERQGNPFRLIDLMAASKAYPSGKMRNASYAKFDDGTAEDKLVNLNLSEAVVKASLRASGWISMRLRQEDGTRPRLWTPRPTISKNSKK